MTSSSERLLDLFEQRIHVFVGGFRVVSTSAPSIDNQQLTTSHRPLLPTLSCRRVRHLVQDTASQAPSDWEQGFRTGREEI